MEPGRISLDVSSRLVGIDLGSDRSRIAIAAQIRNALAKLRSRRGLLNQELTLILAEMGESAAALLAEEPSLAGSGTDETRVNKSDGLNGAIDKKSDSTKPLAAVKKPDFIYSRLQQLYLKGAHPSDLNDLFKERAAIQEKIVQFQQRAGKRLPVQKPPPRLKTHWDCVLDEMRWMAADFTHEDVWKRTCALSVANQTAAFLKRKESIARSKEQTLEFERWQGARKISQMITGFWSTIRRLKTMQRNRAPLDLVIKRADQYRPSICNDLAIDANPINEYFRSGDVLSQKPPNDPSEAWVKPDVQQLTAQRDTMVRLRFDEPIADFADPLCNTALFDHQKQCVAWMDAVTDHSSPSCFIIADDPGLGKRVSVMAWMSMETTPHLVITSSLNLMRWDAEFRCRCPDMNVFIYTNRESWPAEIPENSVVLTSFDMPLSDIRISSQNWKFVVIDPPADYTIDFTSPRWSNIAKLNTTARILLFRNLASLQTNLQQVQLSMLNFIAPRTFRDLSEFEALMGDRQFSCKGIFGHGFLNAFCLRRTYPDVRSQLPSLQESVIPLQLTERQLSLYQQFTPVELPGTLQELVRSVTRLHLICTHPDLLEHSSVSRSIVFNIGSVHPERFFIEKNPIRAVSAHLLECVIDGILPRNSLVSSRLMLENEDVLRSQINSSLQSAAFPATLSIGFPNPIADLSTAAFESYRDSVSIRTLKKTFVPSVTARVSAMDPCGSQQQNGVFDISDPPLRDTDSNKLVALFNYLRELYRPAARIAIVASSFYALDVIQQFLRRHRFRHFRELPVPTCSSIGRFARDYLSGESPFVYLTTSRTISVFSYPSLSLFSSVFVFDHDWNPRIRQHVELFVSMSARLGKFQLYRLVFNDTFDEYAYRFGSLALCHAYFDKLLFGPFADPSETHLDLTDAEAIISRSEASVDMAALNVWRRLSVQGEMESGASLNNDHGPDLSHLLRRFEFWALRRNPAEISPDPVSPISDSIRVVSCSNPIPQILPAAEEAGPKSLPTETKLALACFRSNKKTSNENGILPPGVIVCSGSLMSKSQHPVLYYRRIRRMPLDSQLRHFAIRYKLAYDPNVKGPPAPLLPLEQYVPPPLADDDVNDPFQWGLFASAESQAQMFRVRSGLPPRKKKKPRRRGPRLATVIIDDIAGTMRIRISKKMLASCKRKADESADAPSSKRPRPAESGVSMAPSALPKPISMSHPVPFSDDEDALIVCSVLLFGANFHIATNILESDLIVRGRLRTPKLCSDRYAFLVRRVKEFGPHLWDKLQANSNRGAPVPPLPNADPQHGYRAALEWLRYRSQIRNKASCDKTFDVISGAVRVIMQNHMQCKLTLRTPLSGIPTEAFKEALMRSHASHAAALTAGHKRLMIPHANIGSTLSPRQIVELRALRDRTHESKKMSAMAPQQMTSPSIRATKMPPTSTTPLLRAASVPLAMSPVMIPPSESSPTVAVANSSQDLDQVNGELDQGNMFLLRQLVQKQPHMKARLVQILQRPDLNQTQKMELAVALFNSSGSSNVNTGAVIDESPIAT